MNDLLRPTLFQQALGAAFFNLPAPVRQLHAVRGSARYAGIASVERGRNPLARLCARIGGLPGSMREVPVTVEFTADARGETWRRDFAGTRMTSRLAFKDGLRLFGVLPLPARWFRGVRCCERGDEGRYQFTVEARLPLVGHVIRYEGWLAPVDDAAA